MNKKKVNNIGSARGTRRALPELCGGYHDTGIRVRTRVLTLESTYTRFISPGSKYHSSTLPTMGVNWWTHGCPQGILFSSRSPFCLPLRSPLPLFCTGGTRDTCIGTRCPNAEKFDAAMDYQ